MNLEELTRRFATADPGLALSRSLQQRVDRKFLLAERHLESLLPCLQRAFSALTAEQCLWARYDSIYFDTPGRALFHAHRCDRRPRVKVRIRRHLDRQLAFLEVKRREVGRRTIKYRLPIPITQAELFRRERAFIAEHAQTVSVTSLISVLSVSFQRLTLVGDDALERITLDRKLAFACDGRYRYMPRLVVGEIKQERIANHSGSVTAFRTVQAREVSFSKYCIGTVLLAGVPANVFKPSLRAAARQSA